MALDSRGNLYVADTTNHCIRKITPAGAVTTFAGMCETSGNTNHATNATMASFSSPEGVAVDSDGNVYVADTGNHVIRRIAAGPTGGAVTTFAGSTMGFADNAMATMASFNAPQGIAVDSDNNVYVADTGNHRIRRIAAGTTVGGAVSTFAGSAAMGSADNATATMASFNAPQGIAVDSDNNVYVADTGNHVIRRIAAGTTVGGAVSTFAGSTMGFADNATATDAQFKAPQGLAVDSDNNVYVADTGNHRIRRIAAGSTTGDAVTTVAGGGTAGFMDGAPTAAQFNSPRGIAVRGTTIYVSDTTNHRIRRIGAQATTPPPPVSTLVGSGTAAFTDASGAEAQFSSPEDLATDSTGNVYVADTANHCIRKITSAGVVTTFAGTCRTMGSANHATDATMASFNAPEGLAVDGTGNVYVADTGNHVIRRIAAGATGGAVTTLAGTAGTTGFMEGTGAAAQFSSPKGIAINRAGTELYVADTGNHRIRKITNPAGVVTTLAGSGTAGHNDATGAAAQFSSPEGIAINSAGTELYVADTGNHRIRKVTSPAGVVTTFAGGTTAGSDNHDSNATMARFSSPEGLALDATGANLYIADTGNHVIRRIVVGTGTTGGAVTTVAGSGTMGFMDGALTAAQFNSPRGIVVRGTTVYVGDTTNHRIRRIVQNDMMMVVMPPAPGTTSTLAGNGMGVPAQFSSPEGLATDSTGNVYVADTANHCIRKVTTAGVVTTFAGMCGTMGSADNAAATMASFNAPESLALDSAGANLYVADTGNHIIRRIVVGTGATGGAVTTLAGTAGTAAFMEGAGTAARFNSPKGIAINSTGSELYVADTTNHRIRKVIIATRVVSTFAGSGTMGDDDHATAATMAQFNAPEGLALDSDGTNLYVADTGNHIIRRIVVGTGATGGAVTTFAGMAGGATAGSANNAMATMASFSSPQGLALDATGANLYVADTGNHVIRRIVVGTGTTGGAVTTLAGRAETADFTDGAPTTARFNSPRGIVVRGTSIYVGDTTNHRIRSVRTP